MGITTLRAKLLLIVSAATFSLAMASVGSAYIAQIQAEHLRDLQGRLIPRLELGPHLEAEFEHLGQALQDAVSAQDAGAVHAAAEVRARLFDAITQAGPAIDAPSADAMRWAIQDYFDAAHAVSLRLIAGETGEGLPDDIARMQGLRNRAEQGIQRATRLDRAELTQAFQRVQDANARADRFRIVTLLTGLGLLLALSAWALRSMLQSLRQLSDGLARFATGRFEQQIPILNQDELGAVARDANQMASALQRSMQERDQADWLRTALVGFSNAIRGELEPLQIADQSLRFLAERLQARVAALYEADSKGKLRRLGQYGLNQPSAPEEDFSPAPGLLAEALRRADVSVIEDVPSNYLRVVSGLGEESPCCLIVVPLLRRERAIGVLEFGLFRRATPALLELLRETRDALAIALEGARSRVELHNLLERTQTLVERLAIQEDELRVTNTDLRTQKSELTHANEELEMQRVALSEQNLALDAAHVSLQDKVEELARVSAYKSQFLANMSHDLRTPLNSMLLLSHVLGENENSNLTAQQVLHCRTIHAAGQDLLSLINQVLDLAKIEAGRQDLVLQDVVPSELLLWAQHLFEPLAHDKRLELKLVLGDGLPAKWITDRQRLERILSNLLGNAIKFTERGHVTLRIARPQADSQLPFNLRPDSTIALTVEDTGSGIPASDHERVFHAFEQVMSAKPQQGTGLGLAISRESARLMGGELLLKSHPGQGSTFTCFLPEQQRATNVQPIQEDGTDVVPALLSETVSSEETPLLLIIEDDAVICEHLQNIARQERFEVLVAITGEEGLRLATLRKPHGILLDVRLPDLDGFSVMDRLRKNPVTRAIPVHFVSAVDAPEHVRALGAIGYLQKPVSHEDLVGVVRTLGSTALISRRVLVVEDNWQAGGAVGALLAAEGVDAHHVTTAGAALAALEHGRFGAVILDLGLPDMDGLALLEALRARVGSLSPHIIVHTARALTEREARLLEAYAQAVIVKDGNASSRLRDEIRSFLQQVTTEAGRIDTPATQASELSLQGVKLLLAEDDMRTAYSLSAVLSARGADVLVAENGKEALEVIHDHPDLRAVLMDVMMPEMDGYEAMRRVRRDLRLEALPIIALTAKAVRGERERCLEAGASDYLPKPIEAEQLLRTLATWLHPEASE